MEPAPGAQTEQPAQPRRIEVGIVEGDAVISGGASQVFCGYPIYRGTPIDRALKSTAEDIGSYDVVRFARLPGSSELHVPDNVEVMVREIAGNANVFHTAGRVDIGKVEGNLVALDVPHGVLAEVGGDAVLDTSVGARARFIVHAAANVTLRTHGEINARFVAQTSQGEIQTRLPLMLERGRRRNLVGVIGRGDATVTLHSKNGNITIIAADSDEREYSMNSEFASGNKEREKDGPRTWEGEFGGHRFRAQWDRGPGHAWFQFQGPFTEEDDPDGFGIPFSPDFGFEWERGRGPRVYGGEYEERWDDLREKAERAARRAGKRARHYAERATRHMRDMDWDAVQRDVRSAVDKAMDELEEALANIRREWNKQESGSSKGKQGPKAKRVPIEYDEETPDTFDDDSTAGTTSSTPLSREEREAQRRAILEQLRTGAISLEEAERRLDSLR